MCIAIFAPVGKELSRDALRNCFNRNKDGCGMLYVSGYELMSYKSLSFEQFYEFYKKTFDSILDTPFVLHFRLASHGNGSVDMCHPFFVNKELAFVHNGIVSKVYEKDVCDTSDTYQLCEKVFKGIEDDIVSNESIRLLIEKYVGKSKLIFLNNLKQHCIINEKEGLWDNGVWYSNTSYVNWFQLPIPTRSPCMMNMGYDASCGLCGCVFDEKDGVVIESCSMFLSVCGKCLKDTSKLSMIYGLVIDKKINS